MRIGIFIGPFDREHGLDPLIEQAVAAEREGFDSLWTAQPRWADALTMLALAGQRTERIELGTAVIQSYTRHPYVLAQQSATVQAAIGGRFTLGIGVASQESIEGQLGLSWGRPARHMREYLSVLRPLAHDGAVSFRGEYYSVDRELEAPPMEPYPIVVAALGPQMLRAAGELADGTVTWMVGLNTLREHIVPPITSAAAAAGRPSPRICVGAPVAVADDAEAARAAVSREYGDRWQSPAYRRVLRQEGAIDTGDVSIVGNEAEVIDQLRAFAEAGTTDLLAAVVPIGADPGPTMTRTRALLSSVVGRL